MPDDLTLYCDALTSPASFQAIVALEEKQLAYTLATLPPPASVFHALPLLVHGDAHIADPLAISEYLAERFPIPGNPRIFPADLVERAHARHLMLWLRANSDRDELVRIASALVKPGATQLFGNWSIADAALAFSLNGVRDAIASDLADYTAAQWKRRSLERYAALLPAAH